MSALPEGYPVWLADIDATLPVTASYVVHGNIHDRYLLPGPEGNLWPMDFASALWRSLHRRGFEALVVHTPVGQRVYPAGAAPVAAATLGLAQDALGAPAGPDQLAAMIAALTGPQVQHRVALVVDYVSQRRVQGQPHTPAEHDLLSATLIRLNEAPAIVVGAGQTTALHNPVLWLVERPADLPTWMVGGSDAIRQVSIPLPDLSARAALARLLLGVPRDPALEQAAVRFAETTEGMTLASLIEVTRLATDQGVPPDRIEDAVRAYRTGLLKNPWAQPELRVRLAAGVTALGGRVRGQARAVRQGLDILIRSNMGLSGAERGRAASGPRGILFFAGPTGVGKTELAKAMAELIFGDERAMIRFDMSEFASEHAEARLIGSPPGYVGHGQGGELTNAVRQRPFCLVLLDEIEKAHPRILDKFLQILSDGRLTDGSGDTVHFGEAIVVFTSNLGVPPLDPDAPVPRGADLERLVKGSIERAFREDLERPELLGRIGEDNIVVFDYIDDDTAVELADLFIGNVVRRVADQLGVTLEVAPAVRDRIVGAATADLSLGGRGISRVIESVFVNPLSRALFERPGAGRLTASEIVFEEGGWWTLTLTP
nr:ATP-dependent Clp protease ATP-binding subunit [Propionibacterium sp.]